MSIAIKRCSCSFVILLSILPLVPCFSAEPPVFNGEVIQATATKYNYIVELRNGPDSTVCTGIALEKQWVLTAAHCIDEQPDRIVPLGSSEGISVRKAYCHPAYIPGDVGSGAALDTARDLALLWLEEYIEGGVWGQEGPAAAPDSANLIFFGWGDDSSLRKSKGMPHLGRLRCNQEWNEHGQVIDEYEFCAGGPDSSACLGGSGGPIFNTDEIASVREPRTLVGILSKANNGCTADGIYDVYSKLDPDWIKKIIDNDPPDERSRSTCN